MFDTEKFIMEIEKRPIIWKNSEKATTGDRDLKQRAWDEVGAEMYFNKWHLFSLEEKTEKSKALYKKWKNIRDYFLKELKAQRKRESGTSIPKHKKYVYFDMLAFLIPVLESKRLESDVEDFDNTNVDSSLPDLPKEIEFVDFSHSRHEPDSNRNTSLEEKRPSFTCDKHEKQKITDCEEMDADKAFFISLLPTVKKLDDQQKLDFKLEVLQALKKIQNLHSSSTQASPVIDNAFHNLPFFYQCAHCHSFSSISPQTVSSKNTRCPSSSTSTVTTSVSRAFSKGLVDSSDSVEFKNLV